MEGSPVNNHGFRALLSESLVAGAIIVAGIEGLTVQNIVNETEQARQAEHVVELLQETHGPERVIADQQAEATEHHQQVEKWWQYAAATLAIYPVSALVAGGVVWLRRRRPPQSAAQP